MPILVKAFSISWGEQAFTVIWVWATFCRDHVWLDFEGRRYSVCQFDNSDHRWKNWADSSEAGWRWAAISSFLKECTHACTIPESHDNFLQYTSLTLLISSPDTSGQYAAPCYTGSDNMHRWNVDWFYPRSVLPHSGKFSLSLSTCKDSFISHKQHVLLLYIHGVWKLLEKLTFTQDGLITHVLKLINDLLLIFSIVFYKCEILILVVNFKLLSKDPG